MSELTIMTRFLRTQEGPLINIAMAAKIAAIEVGPGPICHFTFFDVFGVVMGTCYGTLAQLHRVLHQDDDVAPLTTIPVH